MNMENKRIYPCVKCAYSTFKRKIAPKLRKWGYNLVYIGGDWEIFSYICTNNEGNEKRVSNHSEGCLETHGRYLCATIPEFLAAAKALAIERGWFKEEAETEEMKWKKNCHINELPKRLRKLAEYRKKYVKHNKGESPKCNTVNAFVWEETPEGFDFWHDIFLSIIPVNLEAVLSEFEKVHPELLDEPKQEVETASEKVEKKLWPCVKCTEQEYEEIREYLHELGFTDEDWTYIGLDWNTYPILQTRYNSWIVRIIGNYHFLDREDQYLCPDIPTFLHDCQEIAIREGWFKPQLEMTSISSSTID